MAGQIYGELKLMYYYMSIRIKNDVMIMFM